jgi:hypothetical protein
MSQAHTIPTALPLRSHSLTFSSSESITIPWTIWTMVTSISLMMVGGIWDFAWHMSVGRDRFWTPPHLLIGTGAWVILGITVVGTSRARDGSVEVLGFHAPAGAFIALWGSLAMIASAPFDNWWHNAYGLDLQFATPPHALLSFGYFAIRIGAMVWMASIINHSEPAMQSQLRWLFLIVGSICVVAPPVPITRLTSQANMHTATCYLAVSFFIPFMTIATGRGSKHKWGCTIVATIYTGLGLGSEWLLPLVPAQPRLGPVYHNVTHLIPLQFPLLLIVPAFVADLFLQRLEGRASWVKAIWVGPAFVLSFLVVQWPFANFLMSRASRNWIFGTAYFAYADPAGILFDSYKFKAPETPGTFALTIGAALLVCIMTTRLGLGLGDWMRRVRR